MTGPITFEDTIIRKHGKSNHTLTLIKHDQSKEERAPHSC